MHLLRDRWLSIQRTNGQVDRVVPASIVDGINPPVDLIAPRPDFRGALYQFLIGLLQTTYAPDDIDEWQERWEHPPGVAELETAFGRYEQAFALDGDGPAFMQDLDPLAAQKPVAIRGLLIDAGSDSNEYFNKPGEDSGMCPACAAQALFTLQINAPSGGVGHRVSLRGGGPLTSLVMPRDTRATLWQKLWLNVLPRSEMAHDPLSGNQSRASDILPWLSPTRVSDAKGVETPPGTVHPLQAYWSMPRRIRLDFDNAHAGRCCICGEECGQLVSQYRTKNYGTNYTGFWMHPLTPYVLDPKREKPPLSMKGQKGGIAYRHWLGLALGTDDKQPPAQVVSYFIACKAAQVGMRREPVLWCFGYDMDNMKARCWYDATLPLYAIKPSSLRPFQKAVLALLDVAREAANLLGKSVKAARFSRPADAGNDPAVPQSFWQATETTFYRALKSLADADSLDEPALAPIYRNWLVEIRDQTVDLFDEWVLAAPIEEMEMKRVVAARSGLEKWLNAAKPMKEAWKLANAHIKEKA